jgi:hypothetical protein
MGRGIKAVALASAVVLGAGILAGCSSSGSDDPSTLSPTAALPTTGISASALPSAAPSATLVGGDPSTWTPVDLTQAVDGTRVKLVVGQFATFSDLPPNGAQNVIVRAKPKGIVVVTQQGTKDGVTSTAGLQAVAPGKATVNVWQGKPKAKKSKILYSFTVKVTEVPATGAGAVGSAAASASASPQQ